jgi:hypothetical protein
VCFQFIRSHKSCLISFLNSNSGIKSILVLEGPGEVESSTKHPNTYQRVENAL